MRDPAGSDALAAWLEQLERQRRIVRLTIAGETRFAAAEDAGRYRDALGTAPPPDLPAAFLESLPDPLEELLARYARTHGPFTEAQVAARFGIGVGPVRTALAELERTGRLVRGEFRPGESQAEWCDAGVLRALRQKSLARLRHEVEPVEPAALARFALNWHGIPARRGGEARLLEAIARLQGAPVPASVLESEVLPARVADYDPRDLDALAAAGRVVWVGREALGQRDGRVALYLAERAPLLAVPPPAAGGAAPASPLPNDLRAGVREYLEIHGASFFNRILPACGRALPGEVLAALWELVWAGEVTNDTFQPLRALVGPRRRPGSAGRHFSRLARPRWIDSPSGRGLGPSFPSVPPEAAGRWSLVRSLAAGDVSPTDRLAAAARQLLERHGVLTRETVHSESQAPGGLPGGFAALYPVLRAMEEAGQVRRGYFVSGCGAIQFALPGALDALRAARELPRSPDPSSTVLAATDPANPYGAALSWPERAAGVARRPGRMAGARVVLIEGALAAWLPPRGERHLLTFPLAVPELEGAPWLAALAAALAGLVDGPAAEPTGPGGARRRAIFIREVDGQPAQESPLGPALAAAGFRFGLHGYMKR